MESLGKRSRCWQRACRCGQQGRAGRGACPGKTVRRLLNQRLPTHSSRRPAAQLARETQDLRAERALVRVRARAHRELGKWRRRTHVLLCTHAAALVAACCRFAGVALRLRLRMAILCQALLHSCWRSRFDIPHGLTYTAAAAGDPAAALKDLHRSMSLSQQLGETTGDADTLGEIADTYAELGDLETAGRFYGEAQLAFPCSARGKTRWRCSGACQRGAQKHASRWAACGSVGVLTLPASRPVQTGAWRRLRKRRRRSRSALPGMRVRMRSLMCKLFFAHWHRVEDSAGLLSRITSKRQGMQSGRNPDGGAGWAAASAHAGAAALPQIVSKLAGAALPRRRYNPQSIIN